MSEELIESTEEALGLDLGKMIDDRVAAMTAQEKDSYLTILFLLNQIPEYSQWIDDNVEIIICVDDEAKKTSVAVIQKPTVKEVEFTAGELGLDVAKSLKCQMLLKNHGVERTADVLKEVYKILRGRDENAIVVSATDSDINKELEAIKAADKFKV